MSEFKYSIGNHNEDSHPKNHVADSFVNLVKSLKGKSISTKKGMRYFAAAFDDDHTGKPHRCNDGAQDTRFLAFDFDKLKDEEAWLGVQAFFSGWHRWEYATSSHMLLGKDGLIRPKARIILEASRSMTRIERTRASLAINAKLLAQVPDAVETDKSVFNASQAIYLPLKNTAFNNLIDGDLVNVDQWLKEAPEIPEQSDRKSANQRADEAAQSDPVLKVLYDQKMVIKTLVSGKYAITCPFEDGHSSKTSESATVYYLGNYGGFTSSAFKCLHESCSHRTKVDYLDKLGITAEVFRDFTQMRRRKQQEENMWIGDGIDLPLAEVVSIEEALERFVFIADGSRVADVLDPRFDLEFIHWARTYAASYKTLRQSETVDKNTGEVIVGKAQRIPVTKLWMNSKDRQTVTARTFKAGGALMERDPEGKRSLNSWRGFNRRDDLTQTELALADDFFNHVHYLFKSHTDRFLDWLAHIEQKPGELPHTAWLHISPQTGKGRNWMASVLTRVWAGNVASNLDLMGMLKTGFNGQLSRKILAVVDEIREGGKAAQWDFAEKLKSTINEDRRVINPKYGRQSVEFNACRWLMFSNSEMAIPLDDSDRRFEVCIDNSEPMPEHYYIKLYELLHEQTFIDAVAHRLRTRDIGNFNPGSRGLMTADKKALIDSSKSEAQEWIERIIAHWPCDFISSKHFKKIAYELDDSTPKGHKQLLNHYKIKPYRNPVRRRDGVYRYLIIRNHYKWEAGLESPERVISEESPILESYSSDLRNYLLTREMESL